MSTSLLTRSIFVHVPKTAGLWVNHVLTAAGIPHQVLSEQTYARSWAHYGHADLRDLAKYDLFKFAFVRHPLDWWRSFCGFRMNTGWYPEHEIDSVCRSDNFCEFVEQVIEKLPGYASLMYERFVGSVANRIEFVGRYENLAEDLIRALTLANEPFDVEVVRKQPQIKVNASDYQVRAAEYTPELAEALAQAERKAIIRFGYAPLPERLGRSRRTTGLHGSRRSASAG